MCWLFVYIFFCSICITVQADPPPQCGRRFGQPPLFDCYHIKNHLLPLEPAADEAELIGFMPRFIEDQHIDSNPGRLIVLTPITFQWGDCMISVVNVPSVEGIQISQLADWYEIHRTVLDVLEECVMGTSRGYGGVYNIGENANLVVYVYEFDTDVGRMIAQYSAGEISAVCPLDWSRESSPINDRCPSARQDREGPSSGSDSGHESLGESMADSTGTSYCSAIFACRLGLNCIPQKVTLGNILFGYLLPALSSCETH